MQSALLPGDAVILAVPAPVAPLLLPGLPAPKTFRAIVNVHFKRKPPQTLPTITGIVNGTGEWLFAFPDRLSATISAADRWIGVSRELLAEKVWKDVVRLTDLTQDAPTLAYHQGTPRHFCRASARECKPAAIADPLAKPLSRWRLDGDRAACHHRGGDPIRK